MQVDTYRSLVVSDNERSAEVFRIDNMVLLTIDLLRVSGLGDVTSFAVLTLEVGVFHEVSVALYATVSKLYYIGILNQSKN
jgi:hypothetical protein